MLIRPHWGDFRPQSQGECPGASGGQARVWARVGWEWASLGHGSGSVFWAPVDPLFETPLAVTENEV